MEYAYLTEDHQVLPTSDSKLAWKNTRIKQEHYKGYCISTVFLPIDHSHGSWVPVHFETYVFESDGENITNWSEQWGRRGHSYDEALRLHEEARKAIETGELPSRDTSTEQTRAP